MLLWLTQYLKQYYHGFHVFHYLTLRAILSSLTALVMSLTVGPKMIYWLTKFQLGQMIREDGPQSHLQKAGTPTMGGLLIIISIVLATLLWANLKNIYIGLIVFITMAYALIGWVDDYRKIAKRNAKGLSGRWKLFWQFTAALLVTTLLYLQATVPVETQLVVPFFKNVTPDLGVFFIIFTSFVIVGSSNAVNLTDGLDGLAIMPVLLVGGAFGIFAYVTGNAEFSRYLEIPFVPGAGEVVVVCSSIFGAGLGFLWFNTYPAQVFMGDIGSLALGGALGIIAVVVRQELILFIMGGIFVLETVSVILQVASFKLTGKRIFKMAPIHHHFELIGWPEPKIIVRFWIITVVLVLCGLATLKLR